MSTRTLQKSFTGGEVTPEMFSRVDLTKNQSGLRTCRNFEVLPHGPVQNRSGLQYVLETKDSTKRSQLFPFIFSSSQSYVLEFGDLYMRIHTAGATLLNASQSITSATNANPGVFTKVAHGYANGQWLFFSGVTGMSQLNGRYMKVAAVAANTFQLTDFAGTAFNTTSLGTFTAGNAASVFELVTPYTEAQVASMEVHYTQSADVFTLVHPSHPVQELKRLSATNWTLTAPSFTPTIATPGTPTVAAPVAVGPSITYIYVTTAIAADGLEESFASANGSVSNTLATAGNYNTVMVATVAGAVRYNVYRYVGGIYGYVGQAAAGAAFIDDNIVPDMSRTPPENDNPFSSADNYPGAVGYFNGRRWFGGTNNKQQNLWATRSGTESNMTYSIPTRDDDSIRVRLTSRQANRIRHIIPISDLLLLTSGAEWKITALNSDVITPTSISYRPEDYIGASNVTPVVTSGAVLYPQDRGGRVREMRYKWEQQGYKTEDISLLAPHLFDAYTIVGSAWVRAPVPVAWWPRSDGVLLGLTYTPEHQVAAWHRHDTDGLFESVCSVPEGNEDALYAIVKRTINGRDVRYIERKHTRQFTALEDCFFVDAGMTYDGAAATTISGLWHLIGETVAVLADGAVHPRLVVSATGTVTLEQQASVVQIGLPYDCDFETVPLALEAAPAAAQGTIKNINKVFLRVHQSSGVFVGPSFDKLKEFKQRTDEVYGTPPRLVDGIVPVMLTPTWQQDGSVCVRQSNPLPLTVLSMTLDVAMGS